MQSHGHVPLKAALLVTTHHMTVRSCDPESVQYEATTKTVTAMARAAEKLAGYVSKGLKSALEAVPSVTTKILSFALMEEKMYCRSIYSDNSYKGCFKCFCSLLNLPLMIDHPDKILPETHSPPLTSSSHSDITPHHDKEDSFYTPHSPIPSPPTSPPPIDISPSPTPSIDPLLPGF